MMEKLTAMRLLGMVDALKGQEQDPAARELGFLERLGLLVDQQWTWRENQALARRLHAAKLKGAAVEDIDYRASRGLDKSVIRALAQQSAWAAQHENIFVLGPTGVGKSFVACALAQKACRDGYSALYTRASALFRDLAIARADGSLRNLLVRLGRIDVLVIDDWAMAPLAESERRDFREICEDRYQTRSTILTSQLPWQVELFFKWIKQHLRIKAFYGTGENAVKTQIWIAVSVYVLVALVRKRLGLQASLYQILQILSLTLFEKTPILCALQSVVVD